ncbi:hypothetical protein LSCM4_03712 [Leishmania orientalis]|uniref:Phosphodiesterase n=1 Tax=Leishmania orientalis TaxID=2249476 RepID=A0A836GTG3_9TRYP|nr:hypothetical protein LSCM4_03712 [Leishmania orientalis]
MSLMPGYPVPRAQWVESAEACAACDKRFSFFISKENCPCCGRLFCSSCLSAKCELSPTAPPKAVCLDCFRKTEDWRFYQREAQQASTHGDGGAAGLPHPTSAGALERKLKTFEEEFERAKSNAHQLREENDSLIDLLAFKDSSIAELREELMKTGDLASAAAQAAETLRVQLQDAKQQNEKMERLLEEAEQRAATATLTNESMSAQIREHMDAKVEWESLVAQLKATARQAEDKYAQGAEELSELRAAMKVTNAHSEEHIKQVTAQMQTMVEAYAHLQKEYDCKVEVLRLTEQHRVFADGLHDMALQHFRDHLNCVTAALARVLEESDGRKMSHARAVSGAGTDDAAARQRTIAAFSEKLVAPSSAAQCRKSELSHEGAEASPLRGETALNVVASSASAPELCAPLEYHSAVVKQEVLREREANARLRADLEEKERLLSELQRGCINAATAARAEVGGLREKLAETKLAYAEWRGWCDACVSELHAVLEAAILPGSDTGVETGSTTTMKSRWAQPTIVEELRYPSVTDVDLSAIAPVCGLEKWEFDTVAEAQRGGEANVLMRIGHQIALNLRLFPDSASLHQWACMLATVQANYPANPYHNRVHAADVLQGVYALMCSCPGLLAQMTEVEKRAVVFAAAVHDIRHPGRSEMFLKNTFDSTYMRYNGFQVLEQMHTATAFHLLARPEMDFTRGDMDDTEALQFHDLVAALIGCTFMGRHASLMEQWSRPLQNGKAYDLACAADRQQVLSLLLHAADIGAQTRGLVVAPKWLGIVEEMCAQGDEEAARGLPLSPGSSRSSSLERGQLFFLETFVAPLFDLLHQLFPTIVSPIQNLRAVHAHYCAALRETRAFPPPVQYREPTEPAGNTAEASHAEALDAREAALREQERVLGQSMRRLREAVAALATREKQVVEREAAVMKVEVSLNSHRNGKPSSISSMDEEELLRATTAVVAREAEVQRRAAEVERMTAALEKREEIASRLSEQLADVAEKMNRRRQLLRYREACVQRFEAVPRSERTADLSSSGSVTVQTGRSLAEPAATAAPCVRISPSSVKMVKLESALEKLSSALRCMRGGSPSPEWKRYALAAACAPKSY